MKIVFVFHFCILVIINEFNGSSADFINSHHDQNCGKDRSPVSVVYEGVAKIETYPWMGYLFYPTKKKRYTTVIVLVTRQIALGTALEIDKLPKTDFRAKVRAVFGCNCSGPTIPIRDYSYHPDYEKNSISALAMVQLETDYSTVALHPICPPPSYFSDLQIFAMTLSDNCNKPIVKLYEMETVTPDACKTFYRKSELDISSLWPTHTLCAKAVNGGECVWRSGAVLALFQGGKWRLLGFGVHGPGCRAPARFLDYGNFHQWVRRSIEDIGKPAISRIGQNVVVLRRSLSNLQRFGPCDYEETKYEIYTDHTEMRSKSNAWRIARYNVSLYAGVEYSCVVFRVDNFDERDEQPKLFLRRWCAGAVETCKDFQYIEIEFFVEITYLHEITYDMKAYGREAKAIDFNRAMASINRKTEFAEVWNYTTVIRYMYQPVGKGPVLPYVDYTNEAIEFYKRFRWMNLRTRLNKDVKKLYKDNLPGFVHGHDWRESSKKRHDTFVNELAKLHYIHGYDYDNRKKRSLPINNEL